MYTDISQLTNIETFNNKIAMISSLDVLDIVSVDWMKKLVDSDPVELPDLLSIILEDLANNSNMSMVSDLFNHVKKATNTSLNPSAVQIPMDTKPILNNVNQRIRTSNKHKYSHRNTHTHTHRNTHTHTHRVPHSDEYSENKHKIINKYKYSRRSRDRSRRSNKLHRSHQSLSRSASRDRSRSRAGRSYINKHKSRRNKHKSSRNTPKCPGAPSPSPTSDHSSVYR